MKLRTGILVALGVLLVPAVAFAGGDGGDPIWWKPMFHLINLVALLGIVIYFAKKPMGRFLKARKEDITADLEEAKRLHEEARAMVAQYEAQLSGLDAEKAAILEEYRAIGASERDRIIGAAERQAEKITQDAERTVGYEIQRAKEALEAEVVRLAAELAEKALREKINAGRQDKLIDNYLKDLESTSLQG